MHQVTTPTHLTASRCSAKQAPTEPTDTGEESKRKRPVVLLRRGCVTFVFLQSCQIGNSFAAMFQ